MHSVPRMAARIRRRTFTLALIVVGLLLVPVQCSLGLHSIFVAATVFAAASPPHEPEHQHAANHHAAHASDGPDGPVTGFEHGRTSASEQSTPSPVKSATVDHPYTIALSRVVPNVEQIHSRLPLLGVTTLAPDGMAIAPELPPPRGGA